jgi:hypothetical protein
MRRGGTARRPFSNPDWYRVKYSLAAERVNWALADDRERRRQLDMAKAESRALLSEIDRRLRMPRAWGLRAINDRVGPELDRFLQGHLKPGLLVLFAGIELAKDGARAGESKASAGILRLNQLERLIQAGAPLDPLLIVHVVEAGYREPSAGLSYNLACFYSQAEDSDGALIHLRSTIELTPPSSWSRLRAEIERDPVLKPLHGKLDDLFGNPLEQAVKKKGRSRHFRI